MTNDERRATEVLRDEIKAAGFELKKECAK